MSTPINLNKVRKARARAAKKVRADANAATFGMTKAEKDRAKRENSRFAPRFGWKSRRNVPVWCEWERQKAINYGQICSVQSYRCFHDPDP